MLICFCRAKLDARSLSISFSFPPAADTHHAHISVDGQYPLSTSPGVPHLRFNRRASEASLASQVSGLADSYTASNIATSESPLGLASTFFPFAHRRVDAFISSLRTPTLPLHPPPQPAQLANTRLASLSGRGCCTTGWPPGRRPCSRATKPVRSSPKPTEWSPSPARTSAPT